VLALKLNIKEKVRGGASRLIGSAVEGFTRRTPSVRAIAQSNAEHSEKVFLARMRQPTCFLSASASTPPIR
jgi:hypothetical protein